MKSDDNTNKLFLLYCRDSPNPSLAATSAFSCYSNSDRHWPSNSSSSCYWSSRGRWRQSSSSSCCWQPQSSRDSCSWHRWLPSNSSSRSCCSCNSCSSLSTRWGWAGLGCSCTACMGQWLTSEVGEELGTLVLEND